VTRTASCGTSPSIEERGLVNGGRDVLVVGGHEEEEGDVRRERAERRRERAVL
jgi:hypothetical protein